MRLAITTSGDGMDSPVDPRFGRCASFAIYDTRSGSFTVVPNAAAASGSGAGIEAARSLSERGVEAVLTGQCGPNAHATLSAAGISVIDGASGTVRQAIDQFVQGRLSASGAPSSPPHAGMPGGGRGMGGGHGMGGGRGAGGVHGGGGGTGRGRR